MHYIELDAKPCCVYCTTKASNSITGYMKNKELLQYTLVWQCEGTGGATRMNCIVVSPMGVIGTKGVIGTIKRYKLLL